jgi:two-component system, LuxR family, sensor kinase FixL
VSKRKEPLFKISAQGKYKTMTQLKIDNENKSRRILETTIDPIISINEKGIIQVLNPATEKQFGYSSSELLGQNIKMLMPSPYKEEHDSYLENYLRTGKAQIIGLVRELQGQRKDGSIFPMELSVSEMWDGDERNFTGVVRDISQLKQAQEAQIQSEKKFRRILETAIDPIITINQKGIIQILNPATEKEFGYSSSELLGQNIKILMPSPYKEEHDSYLENYLRTGKAQIIGLVRELQGQRKDGSIFPMELSVSEMWDDDERNFTGVVRNISHTKKIILELEQFAYVVSHDLKAPLRAINNLSEWIEEDLGDDLDEDTKDNISTLRNRVHRMEDLIQGILDYSRVGKGEPKLAECNLNEVLSEVIDSLAVPEGFSVEVGSNMPEILADQTQLTQVLTNLVSNGIKHHNNSQGKIKVTAGEFEKDGRFIEIIVADDGPGIPPEYNEKVFKIFQTLQARDDKESTGVGLAIVKKIIESSGGKISLLNTEDIGATFHILWPKGTA